MEFKQTTSIVSRFAVLILATAAFLLAGFLGIYLASQSYLRGVAAIKDANEVMTQSTLAIESLDVAMASAQSVLQTAKFSDAQVSFRAAARQAQTQISRAVAIAPPESRAKYLLPANEASAAYISAGEEFFGKYSDRDRKAARDGIRHGLLIMEQYKLEIVEALRKQQVELKAASDRTFASLYAHRHRPLYVGLILTLVFLIFTGIAGYYLTRQLSGSIGGLLHATKIVGKGNLDFRAEIKSADEIGALTNNFNTMVARLQKSKDRTLRLQAITAAFSEALNPAQVLEIVVERGFPALGADTGLIALLAPENSHFEVVKAHGYPEEELSNWKSMSLTTKRPITDAVLFSKPIWISSAAELTATYPGFQFNRSGNSSALVALPLIVQSKAIGAMCLNFNDDKQFADDDKEYMTSLAQLCAQALFRSRLFQETQQALILRDEFLSIASHELKTPLTPLMLQVQQINRLLSMDKLKTTPPEQLKGMLHMAHTQVVRLSKLIEQLLDVARVSTGRLVIERENMDLSKLTAEVIERFSTDIAAAGCQVALNIKPNVTGNWDSLRIEQIITNLLTNALRYSKGQHIDIRIDDDAETATLTVADHGQGIAAKDQERIFGRFERAASAQHYGGLGLGLYITKQIVDRHEGIIHVASEVGKGSTFRVTLPKRVTESASNPASPTKTS